MDDIGRSVAFGHGTMGLENVVLLLAIAEEDPGRGSSSYSISFRRECNVICPVVWRGERDGASSNSLVCVTFQSAMRMAQGRVQKSCIIWQMAGMRIRTRRRIEQLRYAEKER